MIDRKTNLTNQTEVGQKTKGVSQGQFQEVSKNIF